MRHLGNITAPDPAQPFDLPPEGGRTLASLEGRFDLKQTLRPTSDIVALMTLEHQTGFINRAYALNAQIFRCGAGRSGCLYDLRQRSGTARPDQRQFRLHRRVRQTRPARRKGRILADFDLKTRLFRYPLSYMIYSSAFDALKPEIKAKLYRKLYDSLRAKGEDGASAIAILAATRPGLPDNWK